MSVLIKNGLVYDGLGNPPLRKDILIRKNHIIKIGNLKRNEGVVVDATGCLVMPGAIDVTTHSDHHYSLFYEPNQEDFLSQGITSIIGGNCGTSLAPLFRVTHDIATEWGSVHSINANWQTINEYLNHFSARPLGVNFGTFVGYSGLRRGITGDAFRDLTDAEIASLLQIIKTSMQEGALGVSLGLEQIHGMRTPFFEIEKIAKRIAQLNGTIALHIRDSKVDVKEAVLECIEIAEKTGVGIHISHLQPLKKYAKQYQEAFEIIEQSSNVANVHFDLNTLESAPLLFYELLPVWAHEASKEKMYTNLFNSLFASRVIEYLKKNTASDYIITHAPDEALKFLEGKSLRDLASRANFSYEEAILHYMKVTKLRAALSAKIISTTGIKKALSCSQSIISSNSASFGKKEFKPLSSTQTIPSAISYAEKNKEISLEKVIYKFSGLPAKKFQIKKRGSICEGNFADISVWSNGEPTTVFVNGSLAWKKNGGALGRFGNVIRGN